MESSVKHHAVVAAVAIGLTSISQAALLAQYDFTSGSAVASTVRTGVSASNFIIGNTTDEGSIGVADFGLSAGGIISDAVTRPVARKPMPWRTISHQLERGIYFALQFGMPKAFFL